MPLYCGEVARLEGMGAIRFQVLCLARGVLLVLETTLSRYQRAACDIGWIESDGTRIEIDEGNLEVRYINYADLLRGVILE